jgi:hypothetical protein
VFRASGEGCPREIKLTCIPPFLFSVHYIFLDEWKKEFPDAKVLGVNGTQEKLEKDNMKVRFDALWGSGDSNETVMGELKDEFDSECACVESLSWIFQVS